MGVSASALCIAHCLATPVLIALLPGLAWMEGEWVHLFLALAAGAFLILGSRHWPKNRHTAGLKVLAAIALSALILAAIAGFGENTERWITVIAAAALALTHIMAGHRWWRRL
jgi:CHASE2 domain-containing sensor protein